MERHFLHIFTEASNTAITALGILVVVLVAGFAVWEPRFTKKVTDTVEGAHKEMVALSADRIAARIYGSVGASSIDLYQNIKVDPARPHTKPLYDSYLGIAVILSSIGHRHAKSLIERVEKNKEQLSPLDKHVYEACVNNKLFYLATRATDEDKREAESILKEAERIAAEYEASKEPQWWAVKETIVWTMLNFGYETQDTIRNEVQSMMDNRRLPVEWKAKIKKRYDKWASEKGKELTIEIPQA